MPDGTELVAELLEAWRYAREGLIAEVENIPVERWGFRPTPANRDVEGLIQHVVASSLMAVGEITRPDGDFSRQGFTAHIREYATSVPEHAEPAEWLALLRETLDDGIRRLEEAGAGLLLSPIRQFNGQPASRLTWFHHHIAHEMYHMGQLTLYARLTDNVPALTKRIRGE